MNQERKEEEEQDLILLPVVKAKTKWTEEDELDEQLNQLKKSFQGQSSIRQTTFQSKSHLDLPSRRPSAAPKSIFISIIEAGRKSISQPFQLQRKSVIKNPTKKMTDSATHQIKTQKEELAPMTREQNTKLKNLMETLAWLEKQKESHSKFPVQTMNVAFQKQMEEIEHLINNVRLLEDSSNDDHETKEKRTINKLDLIQIIPQNNAVKKSSKGRKSIREITDGLKQKMELLKTSKADMDQFLERIDQYHQQMRQNMRTDLMIQNKKQVESFHPNQRPLVLEEKFNKEKEKRNQVLSHKQTLDAILEQKRMEKIAQKDLMADQGRYNRIYQKQQQALFNMQQRWYMLILMGSRIWTMQTILMEDQKQEYERIQKHRAAVTIQKHWKQYHKQQVTERTQNALFVITRAVQSFLPRLRLRLKNKAADLLFDFLQEAHQASRLMKIIKRYRYHVIIGQKTIKRYLMIKNAQIEVMLKQWERWESVWWQKKIKNANQLNSQETMSKKTPMVVKKKKKEDSVFHVPEDIKMKIIRENLVMRKKEYHKVFAQYLEQCKLFEEKYKKKMEVMQLLTQNNNNSSNKAEKEVIQVEGLTLNTKTGEVAVPVFKLILKFDEMCVLIEQGFMEATSKQN